MNNGTNTNTILLVIILAVIVGFGVWWMTTHKKVEEKKPGIDIEVNLPKGSNN